mgnify:CR=1 FL=1
MVWLDVLTVSGEQKERFGSKVRPRRELDLSRISSHVRSLIELVDPEPDRKGLDGTPLRVARVFEELFSGYTMESELEVQFEAKSDMVIKPDIDFVSMCEHHWLRYSGQVEISYIPDRMVCGQSKLSRLVTKYSRRLTLQERMCSQVADELMEKLKPLGVMVIARGTHACETDRGIMNSGRYITSAIRGKFSELPVRTESLLLILIDKLGHNRTA